MPLKRLTLLLFVLFAAVAEARLRPQPGEFGFEGEWIYFSPSFDYPYTLFAASVTETAVIGSDLANPFDYQSGFRVGGAYAFCECCLDFHVRYTWLLLQNSRLIKGYANMTPLFGGTTINLEQQIAAIANQENTFDYDDVDSYFGVHLCCGPCFDFALLGGIRYAQVELRYETTYGSIGQNSQENASFDKRTSCFWGIGPEVGLDVAYSLGCGFSVAGRAEGGLLVSRMRGRLIQRIKTPQGIITSLDLDIDLDRIWRLVPLYDIHVGIAYDTCCRWLTLSIEGGYEVLSYLRALPIFGDIQTEPAAIGGYSNADLHGPYINVAIRF